MVFAAPMVAAQDVTLDYGQPTFEGPGFMTVTVTGPPGTQAWLLISLEEGETTLPKFGTFGINFTPDLIILPLGVIGPSGVLTFPCWIDCLSDIVPGISELITYSQVAARLPTQEWELSNVVRYDLVLGDCDALCEHGIEQLGLETVLEGVSGLPETLLIEVRKDDATGDLNASFSQLIDLADLPALPLSNAEGSIQVTLLEFDGTKLRVRFIIDALLAEGLDNKLKAWTYFSVSAGAVSEVSTFHTSCSQPIEVGSVFDGFVVTNMIDVGPDGGGMGGMGGMGM
ncbi:MAG: hypothetical protein DRQ55_12450 [Planctomycetota bacterium]|nr:MAG: hypothetical protein DRQ55_12450 [Planctomycetota bacterium]